MTTAQAAAVLSVGERQVRNLVESGRLAATGRVGRSWLVSPESVQDLARIRIPRGRPWSSATAWAAIDLLDNVSTTRLAAEQRSRLRTKLRGMDAERIVRSARTRATVMRFRTPASLFEHIREYVVAAGVSAVDESAEVAELFGLTRHTTDTLDGYLDRSQFADLLNTGFLADDPAGNVTLRVVDEQIRGDGRGDSTADSRDGRVLPQVAIALDLAESADPRTRAAGLAHIHTRQEAL